MTETSRIRIWTSPHPPEEDLERAAVAVSGVPSPRNVVRQAAVVYCAIPLITLWEHSCMTGDSAQLT